MELPFDLSFLSQAWEQFLLMLDDQPPERICFFLFLGAFLENLIPPIPGDTLIVFGAYLAGMGIVSLVPAYLAMWLGSTMGCLLVYAVAYWKGRAFFLGFKSRIFSEKNLDRVEAGFSRYGDRIVIFNRFLPTVRAFVGIVAGISRIHPVRMFFYVVLSTLLWNTLLVYFGLKVGENWGLVVDVLRTYNRVILVLMAAGGIGYWLWRRKKRRERSRESIDPTPPETGAS
ncbi:MAG: DedA family protein [Gemmatimonadota bacterium]|nr:DedA family protein [Gemmatimonadota bacterium]